ncbi:hypothetical protein [Pseudoalteromonas rubra]|uniref:Uncharacterized protein n=1 Tax=Pseudoalteromonas rubra TaxID=43658 RepID=A0A0U3IBS2_9GAMM|nr:hypothetical protein [Pseudoalteromonas rubra]ALU44567.1 hypothetical protein AT705_17475 [Pseudoalteromonas rubra]
MFSYENFKLFYDLIENMLLPLFLIALCIGWKNINVRYLMIVLVVLEVLDNMTYEIALGWGNPYYIWSMFMCVLFIIPVLGRRLLAERLQSRSAFFRQVNKHYYVSKQEGAFLFVHFISLLINLVTYIEVTLYTHYVIDSYPIRNNLYSPVQSFVHIAEGILVLTIANRFRKERYETTDGAAAKSC